MFADVSQPPSALPQPQLQTIRHGLKLLPPLLRRPQAGPGMILVVPDGSPSTDIQKGVPSLTLKWAEEGYAVIEIDASLIVQDTTLQLQDAIKVLSTCTECSSSNRVGIVVYDSASWSHVAPRLSDVPQIQAAVVYTNQVEVASTTTNIPTLVHIAGQKPADVSKALEGLKMHCYPSVTSSKFAVPFTDDFHYNTEAVSHTRNLTFLKPKLGGPYFDLETIWDEHCYYEFADRSVEHTMSTMVQEPYVNHLPTMTGGVGRSPLTEFYREDFIFSNSSDAELELISRTIGIDRIVDEFVFKFTHDMEVPWILPGVPPTGLRVETPFTGIINIRGDRLYHEHIAWDQASVLRQLGLLPEYLPWPYQLPDGSNADKRMEYRLPVAGIDTTNKLRDRNSRPSNEMFGYKLRVANASAANGHKVNGIEKSKTNGVAKVNGIS